MHASNGFVMQDRLEAKNSQHHKPSPGLVAVEQVEVRAAIRCLEDGRGFALPFIPP